MSNLPPAEVLAARLEHELRTARIYTKAEDFEYVLRHIDKARETLAQLQEAMK